MFPTQSSPKPASFTGETPVLRWTLSMAITVSDFEGHRPVSWVSNIVGEPRLGGAVSKINATLSSVFLGDPPLSNWTCSGGGWLPWSLDMVGNNSLQQNWLHQLASLPGANKRWQCNLAGLEGSVGLSVFIKVPCPGRSSVTHRPDGPYPRHTLIPFQWVNKLGLHFLKIPGPWACLCQSSLLTSQLSWCLPWVFVRKEQDQKSVVAMGTVTSCCCQSAFLWHHQGPACNYWNLLLPWPINSPGK